MAAKKSKKPKGVLHFVGVSDLLEYASKKPAYVPYENKARKEPGIYLVKDQGIYVMPSNTDGMKGKLRDKENRSLLVYAQDPHNPDNEDKYSWTAGQAAMGGDDCAYLLDLPKKDPAKVWPDTLTITVRSKSFKYVWSNS